MKKMMKVLIVAIAVMILPITSSQRAFAQNAPEIDSYSPSNLADGSSGTITIYGNNLTNSDGSCGTLQMYTEADSDGVTGFYTEVNITGVAECTDTAITLNYSLMVPAGSGYEAIMDFWVTTDGGSNYGNGPDLNIYDPD